MADFRKIFNFIPEVKSPEEKKVDFNTKLKWTLIILGAFFILMNIPLFGLSSNALARFEYLATILGTDFGSIISLGIGPIVMASIILQLLAGAQIINIDTSTEEGKKFFTGLQKLLTFFFILFEAIVFVMMQGLQANPGFAGIVILQLILGGLAIFYMDDVMQKWGFGSGVSLFIAAGVSLRLFTSAFQFLGTDAATGGVVLRYSGKVFVFIQSIIDKDTIGATAALAALLATVIIFLIVVWAQSLKVEIPLSFGRIRGYGVKWPLSFFYAGVMPIILTAALMAQVQMFGGIFENAAASCLIEGGACVGTAKVASWFTWMGHFVNGRAVSGLAFWVSSNNLLDLTIRGGILPQFLLQGLTHILTFVVLSTLFAVLWVQTSGQSSKEQAKKIASSGLQVAGFRQDTRILESILDRYIMPLTIMGGAAIGLLASLTNLLGALVSGTSILLVIMIMFQFYQNIAQQHAEDMNPMMRKFMGG
jgi:preprotein translocase subunit SecY